MQVEEFGIDVKNMFAFWVGALSGNCRLQTFALFRIGSAAAIRFGRQLAVSRRKCLIASRVERTKNNVVYFLLTRLSRVVNF